MVEPTFGIGWSTCTSDEEARASGFTDRDSANIQDCKDKGYMTGKGGIGNWKDCGNWKFQLKCISPQWKDGTTTATCIPHLQNTLKYKTQVEANGLDWSEAALFMINTIGTTYKDKQVISKNIVVDNTGAFVEVYVKDDTCGGTTLNTDNYSWGVWNNECTNNGTKYYSKLNGISDQSLWESACYSMIEKTGLSGKILDKRCVSKTDGIYGEVYIDDEKCKPVWGEFSSQCLPDYKKKYFAKLDTKSYEWEKGCEIMPEKDFNGEKIKAICIKKDDGIYGEFITKDVDFFDCDQSRFDSSINNRSENFDINTLPKCYENDMGQYGQFKPNILEPITTDTVFTLEATNWISGNEGKKTFLKGVSGAIRTDDDVRITQNDLPETFHFKFVKDGCQTDKYILYGNMVQLYSVFSKEYIQCGGGTCSGVKDSGECNKDKWQTFTIESRTGKTGRVCFGDNITINQVVGDNASITPAGGGNVWATAPGTSDNSILTILTTNGSLYINPETEMKQYDFQRVSNLCEKDPANAICTKEKLEQFFNQYGLYAGIAAIGMCLFIILILILK